MGKKSLNQTPDAATRLWHEIQVIHAGLVLNRREIGKRFWELRNLYSERGTEASSRPTRGHGTFQFEIKARGYEPRRVREWINDHEVELGLRPAAQTTATKQKARRQLGQVLPKEDPLTRFARLLPYSALRAAYRAALRELHPDHGGSEVLTRELIAAWEAVERGHKDRVQPHDVDGDYGQEAMRVQ